MPAAFHDVVPVAVPLPPRLLDQLTWVTPTRSLAVPPTVIAAVVEAYVADVVGAVMATTGAVTSGVTVHVNERDADCAPSETETVTAYTPVTIGTPERSPAAPSVTPEGR